MSDNSANSLPLTKADNGRFKMHGLWFEDFSEGLSVETRGRTITEADIVNFAAVTGDYNPMHTDAEFAKGTQFGARIAHGALIFSAAVGLVYQLGIMEGTIVAFTGFEMKMRAPVYIGDTIHVVGTVTKMRAMASAGGGLISFDMKILNQTDAVVQKGELSLMFKSKPQSGLTDSTNTDSE